ncbi:MAG: hypothetical protein JNJ77_20050 [Planctomycetia bacterium]|nr:hypothetical protein [Planctomycetia bacterium]
MPVNHAGCYSPKGNYATSMGKRYFVCRLNVMKGIISGRWTCIASKICGKHIFKKCWHPKPPPDNIELFWGVESMIEFACWGCGKSLKAKPELAGRKCKCSKCSRDNTIPKAPVVVDYQEQPPPVVSPPVPAIIQQPERKITVPPIGSVFCFKCGSIIFQEAEICPHCGVRQHNVKKKKNPSGILFFFLVVCILGMLFIHTFGFGILAAIVTVFMVIDMTS